MHLPIAELLHFLPGASERNCLSEHQLFSCLSAASVGHAFLSPQYHTGVIHDMHKGHNETVDMETSRMSKATGLSGEIQDRGPCGRSRQQDN